MSKFVSIDIETLGLGIRAPIIQIGLVVADWLKGEIIGEFETNVLHDRYDNCEPYAMAMHPKILKEIAGGNGIRADIVVHTIREWLYLKGMTTKCGKPTKIIVAGKNAAGFDLPMLCEQFPRWKREIPYSHRVLDPGMLYWNPKTDTVPPDLKACLQRARLSGDVAHTAVEDARDVANLIIHYAQCYLAEQGRDGFVITTEKLNATSIQ